MTFRGKAMVSIRTAILLCMLIIAVLALPACVPTNPLATKRVVGLIPTDSFPELEVIRGPASVSVNQLLSLTVITYGSSSCVSSDGAEIDVAGLTATITPFDRAPRGTVACTADLAPHPRDVHLTFHEPGAATIRVIGRNFDGARTTKDVNITITP